MFGVAKTMLARPMAQSAGCTFKRIQCTPDLQPSDVLGGPYLDPQSGRTEFRFGPIFSQFVLVMKSNAPVRARRRRCWSDGRGDGSRGDCFLPFAKKPFTIVPLKIH